MGIGLYVVKEILSLHGGEITLTSQEGEGSTFTICLPVDDQRPTTNDQRPTTNDQRQPTTDERPPTTDRRPPTENQELRTRNRGRKTSS
jgi:two-component system sensor histidine kinase SenX3